MRGISREDVNGKDDGDVMRVQEVMSRDVKTCRPEDDLNRAAQMMWENDIGFVPVVSETGTVLGVVTDRDVCMASYTRGQPLYAVSAGDTMSREVEFCASGSDLEVALSLMRDTRVRRLPVVDAEGKLVGVLSLNDLARAADRLCRQGDRELACEVAQTLAAIGEPRYRKSAGADEPPVEPRRVAGRKAGLVTR
jgi:CBS-domain-containing membrane protein